jgi:hypothetical protein
LTGGPISERSSTVGVIDVEPGLGQEAVEQAGPVPHRLEPGLPAQLQCSWPVTEEEPFLYAGKQGNYRVFVPAVQHDSAGPA